MKNAEKRHNVWYASLTVPEEVRHVINKTRFFQSTKTGSNTEAAPRVVLLVAQWRAEIAKARGAVAAPQDTFWQDIRREYAAAVKADRAEEGDNGGSLSAEVQDVIRSAASRIEDAEHSSFMYRTAIGLLPALPPPQPLTPLAGLVTAWKGSLRTAQKSIDQQHRDMVKMAEHFKHLEELTPQKIKAWTDKLMGEGVTASSFERIGNGCRSFWAYLQQSGTKAMIDPDPFVGPFRLAQRMAVNNKTGRSGSSYTPEQLAKLYAGAIANGDRPLADLIALGAYTGGRIEELCKLTEATARGGVFTMGTKTEASLRDCPIHPAIAPLVARMLAASTDGFLVPSTADNQYGNRSGPLSQRFGHLKTAQGFGTAHVFHSTRNTLATMMERAGVPEAVASDIVGHKKKTLTYGLYSSGSAEEQKLEAISRVTFPAPLDTP